MISNFPGGRLATMTIIITFLPHDAREPETFFSHDEVFAAALARSLIF